MGTKKKECVSENTRPKLLEFNYEIVTWLSADGIVNALVHTRVCARVRACVCIDEGCVLSRRVLRVHRFPANLFYLRINIE